MSVKQWTIRRIGIDPAAAAELHSAAWIAAHRNDMQIADCDDIAQTAVEILASRESLQNIPVNQYRKNVIRQAVRIHRQRQTDKLTSGQGDGITENGRKPEILPNEKQERQERQENFRILRDARRLRRNAEFMVEQFSGFVCEVLHDVCNDILTDIDHPEPFVRSDDIPSSLVSGQKSREMVENHIYDVTNGAFILHSAALV